MRTGPYIPFASVGQLAHHYPLIECEFLFNGRCNLSCWRTIVCYYVHFDITPGSLFGGWLNSLFHYLLFGYAMVHRGASDFDMGCRRKDTMTNGDGVGGATALGSRFVGVRTSLD